MDLRQRIEAFVSLGKFLGQIAPKTIEKYTSDKNQENFELDTEETIKGVLQRTELENGWFTPESIKYALENWSTALSEKNILEWVSKYTIDNARPQTVAVIMAGNIPMVGFHDFLSVLITGNKVLVKLSSNDKVLLPFLADHLIQFNLEFKNLIEFTEGRLKNFDAIIATGSNNTARYFDYYFAKYPHIIRKNRNSVAVLNGNETEEELRFLADDIFQYFGLGCRNISKIYLPVNYDFDKFFNGIYSWKEIIYNNKYMNNYDYNKAVYLMDSFPLLDNEFLLLKEDQGFSSPIAVVFYERYNSLENLRTELQLQSENIQCVVSKAAVPDAIAFGKAQKPDLWDYADSIDTIDFLLRLQS